MDHFIKSNLVVAGILNDIFNIRNYFKSGFNYYS